MILPVIILGGGGHAKVLIEALRSSNIPILGITEADPTKWKTTVMDVPVLGDDVVVGEYAAGSVRLVNGIGSVKVTLARSALFEAFKSKGYVFAAVVHPSAVIASDVILGEGAQIMAGAVIQPGSRIGSNTIVNSNATVDHDCTIGDHVHIAPGVTLSGGVRLGSSTHVGTAASVIEGITIGSHSVVAAGAVVIEDIPDNVTVMGVPAKVVNR